MVEKVSKKTIVISEKTHQRIKVHCAKNNLKLNDWIDNMIWKTINEIESELGKINKGDITTL